MIAPVIVWVVETGIPQTDARRTVPAPAAGDPVLGPGLSQVATIRRRRPAAKAMGVRRRVAPTARVRAALGRNVRALREKKKLTQETLGDRAELHATYISDIERGIRNPSALILLKLVDLVIGLRVDVDTEREGLDLAVHGEVVQ